MRIFEKNGYAVVIYINMIFICWQVCVDVLEVLEEITVALTCPWPLLCRQLYKGVPVMRAEYHVPMPSYVEASLPIHRHVISLKLVYVRVDCKGLMTFSTGNGFQ